MQLHVHMSALSCEAQADGGMYSGLVVQEYKEEKTRIRTRVHHNPACAMAFDDSYAAPGVDLVLQVYCMQEGPLQRWA